MHMPSVRHQQSYFKHPVVENYVKAKGKFNIFSYTKPVSLSKRKLFYWSAQACTNGMYCFFFFNSEISEAVEKSSLFKVPTTLQSILTLQPQTVYEVLFVSNGLNLVREINETSNILGNKNRITT